jgi:hypothetical protein
MKRAGAVESVCDHFGLNGFSAAAAEFDLESASMLPRGGDPSGNDLEPPLPD